MKKKTLVIALILMIVITTFSTSKVEAATPNINAKFKQGEYISNIYIKKVNPSGTTTYQQANIIRRQSDWMWIYCIQPGVPIDADMTYYGNDSDWAIVTGMTQAQWKRVQLLSYYGYNYTNGNVDHTDTKWYAITQVMIWQTVSVNWDIYFTDTLNGNKVANKFASEIAELESLLANHDIVPSFDNSSHSMPIGSSLTLTDTNGVLSNFNVETNGNLSVNKSGNNLVITANSITESTTLTLTKKDTKYSVPPIAYVNPDSQDVIATGSYDPVEVSLKIKVFGGKVTLEKVDSETKLKKGQGDAILGGAVYGVYDENGTLLTKIITGADGTVTSGYLSKIGKMTLKEISPSLGYLLDETVYNFEMTVDNLYPTVNVTEDVIKREVTVFKVFANGNTGILSGEPDVSFDVYLKSSGELFTTITTDSRGYASTTLPYGTYIFSQKNSTKDHEYVEDFEIVINNDADDVIYRLLSNAQIEAKLKVVKVDSETGDVIPRAGIKFKIKDLSTGEYVCQNITYPTAQKVCVFETDENGVLITPSELFGSFQLEEVEDQQVDGYLWNSEPLEFYIGDGSEFVVDEEYGIMLVVEFENTRVKGKIEVNKIGEELIIENDSFHYIEIPLPEVKYGIYANEDIFVNGVLKHSKGELVATIVTDKDGFGSIDDLELGKYYILELESSLGNLVDKTKYNFELVYQDQYTAEVVKSLSFTNHLLKGKLEFTKTDLVTGEPIPNTLIEIYHVTEDGDVLIFSGLSDEDGKIVIDELFEGKFYILERESADGYLLTDEIIYFEITEDGQIIKANMTNEQIVEVPNTLTSESNIIPIISISLMLIGLGVFFYASKKKK